MVKMNTEYLRYFIAVCDCKSVPKAAEMIHISPQGLNKALRKIESQYHIHLFERKDGMMLPTEATREIYPEIKKLIEQENRIESLMDLRTRRSRIRFAVPENYEIGYVVRKSIEAYNAAFNAEIECMPFTYSLSMEEQDSMMVNRQWDVRILNKRFDKLAGFKTAPLCTLRFYPVTDSNNPLCQQRKVTWNDLERMNIIAESKDYPYVKQIIEMCREYGFDPKIVVAEGDLFVLNILEHDPNAVYFTKHPLLFTSNSAYSFKTPNLEPLVSSHFILQGRNDTWNPSLMKWVSERTQSAFR